MWSMQGDLGDLNDIDLTAYPPSHNDVLLYNNDIKKWISKPLQDTLSTSSYVLELERWNIKNDETAASDTSSGINNALAWAAQQGYTEVVLPRGTYLIDKNIPIEPQSYLTLNLNGSTLKIETNDLASYSIISFHKNQVYARITNGIIQGDKDTHDYSGGGTHEWGYGIAVGSFLALNEGGSNTRFISLDNLDIFNCTGDAITLNSAFGQIKPFPVEVANSFEQGSINTSDGTLTSNNEKIRSKSKIDMKQKEIVKYGYFGFYGNGYGALGADIVCDYYDVFFYDISNNFIVAKVNVQFFDEVGVPKEADYARVVLHQSKIPSPENCLINVRVPSFPQYTYIEKCNLHHCRRQGISIGGAKHVYICGNDIHHIDGTDPQSGIDIEDGYDLNQYIFIDKNNFYDNKKYNIIVVNGKFIYIVNNSILNTVSTNYVGLSINGGADKVIVTGNSIRLTKVSLSGDTIFSHNNVYGSQINVRAEYENRPLHIVNNAFLNCKMVIDTPFPYVVKVDSCHFFNDINKLNALSKLYQWTLELKNEPQTISNCVFEGQDVFYLNYATAATFKGGWVFESTVFKNVKDPTLFAGTYSECFFTDVGFLRIQSSATQSLELRGCKFISKDINNILFSVDNLSNFKMIDCDIEKPNGTILSIKNVFGEVWISNNVFKITNDTLKRSIIVLNEGFLGKQVVIQNNNIFAKNLKQIGIENQINSNQLQIVMKNNICSNATIDITGKEFLHENIINGTVDPYYNASSAPTSGYYKLGQEVKNSNPIPGGYIGWVCVKEGFANNELWIQSKSYEKGSKINVEGHVYEALNRGVSNSITPLFQGVSGGLIYDNTITWREVGLLAEFKTFGSISL
ncbi:right-handed parallel beta-helix repeat-containing protein [Bacillus manliponensis]|uniref:right-handed parallel beta-helix repeat-containing protein n=1 Tax=Bacillus manliponensis TaxID=574376 RepID=UPI0035181C39